MTRLLIAWMGMAPILICQNPVTSQFPAALDTDQTLGVLKNSPNAYPTPPSTLTANVALGDCSASVADGTAFAGGVIVTIGSEKMQISSVVGNTLNFNCSPRNFGSTVKATHSSGDSVWTYVEDYNVNAVAAAIKSMQAALGVNLSNVNGVSAATPWQANRVSNTQLSFGAGCLPNSPCNANISGVFHQYTNGPWVINLANSHSGTIYVYIDPSGTLSAGVPSALSATVDITSPTLAIVGGVDSQPAGAILETWPVSSGTFNSTGSYFGASITYYAAPLTGFTGTKTAGSCVLSISNGQIITVTGC